VAKDFLFVKVAIERARVHLIYNHNVLCLEYVSQERMFLDNFHPFRLHVIVCVGVEHLVEFIERIRS
tara:strand:- start:2020 stop:2220 length:201 start_codon:yes stop_codon:yes gene_type:complete